MNDLSQDTDGLAAREAAARLLEAALARRSGLDEALSAGAFSRLDGRGRAFARALTMATLRHLGPIDRALAAKLQREPPERVRTLLRLGAAQAFHMDVPDFAAVDTAVALAPAPFKKLVNAVLRGLLREGAPPDEPAALAPDWLLARWKAAYGEAQALAIAAAIAREPATDVTPRGEAGALAQALEGQALPGGSVRAGLKGDIATWPGYAEGSWWIQDAAAAIPARLTGAGPGLEALDLCAAPGGKALQLAAMGADVTALDRSAARLRRLSENLARTGLRAQVVAADAVLWHEPALFDTVLLDAPCTATGTFRRNPETLWAARPGDIAKLARTQAALLGAAAARVRPGGRLVYCVCSLEPEEGEAQAAAFVARHADFSTLPIAAGEGGAPAAAVTRQGWLRILPHHMEGGMDGFFVARFARAL